MFLCSAVIAQWISLRLPSSDPGFKSRAQNLCFTFHIVEFCTAFGIAL